MTAADLAVEHYDLVEKATQFAARRHRIDPKLLDDMRSAAGEALVVAARRFDGRGRARGFLFQAVYYGAIEGARKEMGRGKSDAWQAVHRPLHHDLSLEEWQEVSGAGPLGSPVVREQEGIRSLEQHPEQQPGALLLEQEGVREILESCSPREREIVVRLASGESSSEVANRFGISRKRIWGITAAVRNKLTMRARGEVLEPRCPPGSISVDVSWT